MLLLGLLLAHDLVYARLPEEILQRIQNVPQVGTLAGRVSERLFCPGFATPRLRDEKPIFYWQVRERWRDRLGLFWKYLPNYLNRAFVPGKRDYELVRLPTFLASGYYLIRPVRLAGKFLNKLLRSTNRDEK